MTEESVSYRAADGTIRQVYYGEGKQPWDIICELGWGPEFAAGNVLKYVRRHSKKGGDDDLKKAQWYLQRLLEMAFNSDKQAISISAQLVQELSKDEYLQVLTWKEPT